MSASIPGLIGAGLGLLIALVSYALVSAALERDLAALDPTRNSEERIKKERANSLVRKILLADFVVFAGVGYYLGQLLAS